MSDEHERVEYTGWVTVEYMLAMQQFAPVSELEKYVQEEK